MFPAAFLNSDLTWDTDCAVKIRKCKGFRDWWVNLWTITGPADGEGPKGLWPLHLLAK